MPDYEYFELSSPFRIDDRNEKMNYKIREAQTKKTPYTLIIGDAEKQNNQITYRRHGSNESVTLSLIEAIDKFDREVKSFGK